jgi:glycosyltransferase involved in cell wall biosynthesis
MKKILHVVESFGGGVFNQLQTYMNALKNGSSETYIAYSKRDDTPDDFQAYFPKNTHFFHINLSRDIDIIKDIRGLIAIRRIINIIQPDVIHLHSSKAGFIGRATLLFSFHSNTGSKPMVFYTPHGFYFLNDEIRPIKKLFYRYLEKLATFFGGTIVACSKSEGDIARRQLKAKNVVVIENAIDSERFECKEYGIYKRSALRIGTAGRLCVQKNPLMFADLASRMKEKNVQFTWIGDGDRGFRKHLENKKVFVTGWLKKDDVPRQLNSLDVYIQTSRWEGMPLSVMEAMASGLPAIVTGAIGNRDVVSHGETGFIASTIDEMIHYIEKYKADRDLIKKHGQTASNIARNRFTIGRLTKDLERLYGL